MKMAGGVGILSRKMKTKDKADEETQIVGDKQVTSNSQGPEISASDNKTLNDTSKGVFLQTEKQDVDKDTRINITIIAIGCMI